MSTSTRIMLPLTVRSTHLLQVVGKLVGVPSELDSLESCRYGSPKTKPSFDPALPASEGNPWHVSFTPKRGEFEIAAADSGRDLSFGYLRFTDIGQSRHEWAYAPETEHEDHKMLFPNSSSLAVAVGLRVVKFFGGRIEFQEEGEGFARSTSRALFPPKARNSTATSNDRWYQFYNALNAVPLLTVKELDWASQKSAYGLTERDAQLRERLLIEDEHALLSKTFSKATPAPSRSGPRL